MSEKVEKAKELFLLSEEMYAKIQQSDWGFAKENEDKRQQLAKEVFDGGEIPADEVEAIAEYIKKTIEINSKMTALTKEGKDEVAVQIRKMRNGQRVKSAYK